MISISFQKIILLTIAMFLAAPVCQAAEWRMPSECGTLRECFAEMSAGDTLTIADGVYFGDDNRIMGTGSTYVPPSGTCSGGAGDWCATGSYTTVRAENPGQVVIDGQNSRDTLCFGQVGPNPGVHHVVFDGLQFVRAGGYCGQHDFGGESASNRTAHHVKFLRCGFQDGIGVYYSSYILLEDVYITGRGRYNVNVGIDSDHVVVRRAVMRLDNAESGQGFPVAHAVSYGSNNVEWQNNICIDSDSQYYGEAESVYGGIYIRQTHDTGNYSSTDNKLRGNILLNVHHRPNPNFYYAASYHTGYGTDGLAFENGIFWDMHNIAGTTIDNDYSMNHMTFGVSTDNENPEAVLGNNLYGDISNSLFYSIAGTAIYDAKSSNFNAFYGNGADKYSVASSANDITGTNPLVNHLKYLPRVENYTGLDGNDGGKIGAEVICRYGVDGTGWGETGYNTLQTCTLGDGAASLWPWPSENTVKAFFLAYGTGGSSPPNARGFTTGTAIDGSAQTLTKYIWEYLGSPIPAEVYGDDTTAPEEPVGLKVE